MDKIARRKSRNEKIEICLKEYFQQDKTILIDSSMMQVEAVIAIIKNNTYFGNKVLFAKRDVEKYQLYTKHQNGETVFEKEKTILEYLKKYPKHYQVVDIENDEEMISFFKANPKAIFYIADKTLIETMETKQIKYKYYKKDVKIEFGFPNSAKFTTLDEIIVRDNRIYIETNDNIKVYNGKLEETRSGEIKLVKGFHILKIKDKGDIIQYTLYKVVSYHSIKNTVNLCWLDVSKDRSSNKNARRPIPYELKKILADKI